MLLQRLLLLALAGAAGTLARYGLTLAAKRLTGPGFDWGTLTCNVLGSLLFGLVVGLAESRVALSAETRVILLGGFMGAFTTFSTYAFEGAIYARSGAYGGLALQLVSHNVLGLTGVLLGLAASRLTLSG